MRSVLIGSVIAIAVATVLLGISEITQNAFALSVTSKGGSIACADCGFPFPKGVDFAGVPGQSGPAHGPMGGLAAHFACRNLVDVVILILT